MLYSACDVDQQTVWWLYYLPQGMRYKVTLLFVPWGIVIFFSPPVSSPAVVKHISQDDSKCSMAISRVAIARMLIWVVRFQL